MIFKLNIREYFFYYLLLVIILITGVFSYLRFIVRHDYIVYYEGECDPALMSCFVGCKDDECTEKYYYSEVQKYTPDLLRECGVFIDDCAGANVCLPTDQKCSITYCDSEVDGGDCALPTLDPIEGQSTDVLLTKDSLK
jgi:hypothetical protein